MFLSDIIVNVGLSFTLPSQYLSISSPVSPCLTHVSHTYFPFTCNWPQYLGHRSTDTHYKKSVRSWARVCVCMCSGCFLAFPNWNWLIEVTQYLCL